MGLTSIRLFLLLGPVALCNFGFIILFCFAPPPKTVPTVVKTTILLTCHNLETKTAKTFYLSLQYCSVGNNQWDQIWQNFTTFVKFKTVLIIFRVYLVLDKLLNRLWQIIGYILFVVNSQMWKIISPSDHSAECRWLNVIGADINREETIEITVYT